MARIDIKNSAPMKALAAAKVKYPDFLKLPTGFIKILTQNGTNQSVIVPSV